MSRNKDNKKKSYKGLVIAIDLLSIGIIVACILMDTLWINNIEYELVSVSIDSFLALIAILSSFVIPYAENRTYQKYNLSNDDLNNIRGDTKTIYINLLIASIIMFAADAIFYMFDLALSLFGVIVVGLLFICVFVAPRIVEYAKGEDAIIEMVGKKCQEYIENPEENETNEIDSSDKIITAMLLDKGFEKTISAIIKGKKQKNNGKNIPETQLFVLLIKKQNKYLNSLITDPDVDAILTSKVTHQLLDNVFYLCNSKSLRKLDSLELKDKLDVYKNISDSLDLLFRLIDEDKFQNQFNSQFTSMLINTINRSFIEYKDTDDTSFMFLNYLFIDNLNDNHYWFVNIFLDICGSKLRLIHRGASYVFVMFAQLLATISVNTMVPTLKDFKDYIEDYLEKEKHNILIKSRFVSIHYADEYHNLIDLYRRCERVFYNIASCSRHSQSHLTFYRIYSYCVSIYVVYTLPLTYYSQIECVDDIIYCLNEDDRSFIIKTFKSINSDKQKYGEFNKSLLSHLNTLSILPISLEMNDFFSDIRYIANYDSRMNDLANFKAHIGVDKYIKQFNSDLQSSPLFNSSINPRKTNKEKRTTYFIPYTISYFLNKNAPTDCLSSESSFSTHSVLRRAFSDLLSMLIPMARHNKIDAYDNRIVKSIMDYKPIYKISPKFDSYCKDNKITLDGCSNLDLPRSSEDMDVFILDGAIKFNYTLSDIFARKISLREAEECFYCLRNHKEEEPISIQNLTFFHMRKRDLTDEDKKRIDQIQDNYYYISITIDLNESVVEDASKLLVYQIVSSDTKDK